MSKSTLVVGASPNADRYSYKAVMSLTRSGHEVYAYGVKTGTIGETRITDVWPTEPVHTVTLYLNPQRQAPYYERIVSLKPKRVIFNPGTENPEFWDKLEKAGIQVEVACTLVMLSVGNY
ncbi:MAG: CoA-binding protein [Bacteroidetes bacterium]|nr:MAG: CoA-binding protein [Bacteroidota bacterium]